MGLDQCFFLQIARSSNFAVLSYSVAGGSRGRGCFLFCAAYCGGGILQHTLLYTLPLMSGGFVWRIVGVGCM